MTDCWQTEQQIQQDAWGSARISSCLSNASMRTVSKCLKRTMAI